MRGLGSLDQQVQDRADTMQVTGKPPSSTVSNDLLNLMASQKVAREKDEALKQLQLAQQQNPATIKDQLEQKLMGMTQNEMTAQTAGILAARGNQKRPPQGGQQRPPQGIAAAGQMGARPMPAANTMGGVPKPMGGAPKPMGGIAGAAPVRMAASGGIVGYNAGGVTVSDERLKELGMTRVQFDALTPTAQQALAPKQSPKLGKTREERSAGREAATAERKARKEQERIDFNQKLQDSQRRQARAVAEQAGLKIADDAVADPAGTQIEKPTVPTSTTETGSSAAVDVPEIIAPETKVDTRKQLENVNFDTNVRDDQTIDKKMASDAVGEKTMGIMEQAAGQNIFEKGGIQEQLREAGDKRYKVEGTDEGLEGLQKSVADEQNRQMSPEVQRAQRLQKTRGLYSSAAKGRGQIMDQQNLQTLNFKQDQVKQFADRNKLRVETLAKVDEDVAKTVGDMQEFKMKALEGLVDVGGSNAALIQQQVDTYIRQNSDRLNAELTAIGIAEEANLRMQLEQMQDKQEIQQMMLDLTQLRAKEKGVYLQSRQLEIDRLDTSTSEGKMAMKEIETAADAYVAAIGAKQEKMLQAALDAYYPGIDFNITDLGGPDKNAPDMNDIDLEVEEADQAALDRNR